MNREGTFRIGHNGASLASMTNIDPAATIKTIAGIRLAHLILWASLEQRARE